MVTPQQLEMMRQTAATRLVHIYESWEDHIQEHGDADVILTREEAEALLDMMKICAGLLFGPPPSATVNLSLNGRSAVQ